MAINPLHNAVRWRSGAAFFNTLPAYTTRLLLTAWPKEDDEHSSQADACSNQIPTVSLKPIEETPQSSDRTMKTPPCAA
jgi:hypothetical protein